MDETKAVTISLTDATVFTGAAIYTVKPDLGSEQVESLSAVDSIQTALSESVELNNTNSQHVVSENSANDCLFEENHSTEAVNTISHSIKQDQDSTVRIFIPKGQEDTAPEIFDIPSPYTAMDITSESETLNSQLVENLVGSGIGCLETNGEDIVMDNNGGPPVSSPPSIKVEMDANILLVKSFEQVQDLEHLVSKDLSQCCVSEEGMLECENSGCKSSTRDSPASTDNFISLEDEDEFVAIELATPSNFASVKEEEVKLVSPDHFHSEATSFSFPASAPIPYNHPEPRNNLTHQTKKKIIHHPLLSPLAKLPWDRLASAAGACDLLFNCKYSMMQVEDEVREEKKMLSCDGVSGIEEEYNDRNDCSDFDHFGEEGCSEGHEFEEFGLQCCSMLDSEEAEEEGDHGMVSDENLEDHVRDSKQEELTEQKTHLISEDQRAKGCWKSSNPSLDMLLYRRFLDE